MAIVRWEPFRDLVTIQDRMNRIFDDAFRGWPAPLERESLPVMPSVDVKETEKAVEVTAELLRLGRRQFAET